MLEVVWNESAAATLSLAMAGPSDQIGGAVGVILSHEDGRKVTRREIRQARKQVEEQERQGWAQAVPLQGNRDAILCFPLALQTGSIQGTGIGASRETVLRQLLSVYPEEAGDTIRHWTETARQSLKKILSGAQAGETIRIWVSEQPSDVCGLHWLMEQLRPMGFDHLDIVVVRLPRFLTAADGTVVQHVCWGELEPYYWGRLAALKEQLPPVIAHAMAAHWRHLQAENAPLRAVVNGRLVSVPENFYDPFILRELQKETGEFLEAKVIGRVLSAYRFGIGDGWVALRIEQWIQDGLLTPVTKSAPGNPTYHRMLRWRTKQM